MCALAHTRAERVCRQALYSFRASAPNRVFYPTGKELSYRIKKHLAFLQGADGLSDYLILYQHVFFPESSRLFAQLLHRHHIRCHSLEIIPVFWRNSSFFCQRSGFAPSCPLNGKISTSFGASILLYAAKKHSGGQILSFSPTEADTGQEIYSARFIVSK